MCGVLVFITHVIHTPVIHVWCLVFITYVIHTHVIHVQTPVIYMFYTCNIGVSYMSNTGVYFTHELHA